MRVSRTATRLWAIAALAMPSAAGAQVQLHAPGTFQGYVAKVGVSGGVESVTGRVYAGLVPHFQLGMGAGTVIDLRVPGSAFTYSSTVNGNRVISSGEAEYLPGVREELQKPGGALVALPCQSCLALSATRLSPSRYLLALYNQSANAISLVELEGTSDGRLRVRSARVESGITTNSLFQLGASRNGAFVVAGGASRTLWWGYTDGAGLGLRAGQADNPPGYQYLASGPGPDAGSFWVAMVSASSPRTIRLHRLQPGANPAFDAGVDALANIDGSQTFLAAFRPDGQKVVVSAYRGSGGTRLRVGTAVGTSLQLTPESVSQPGFGTTFVTPPLVLPVGSEVAWILGQPSASGGSRLYQVNLSTGSMTEAPASGAGFGTDTPQTLTWEAPDKATATLTPPAQTLGAGAQGALVVRLSSALAAPVTLPYTLTSGPSAVPGVDYTDCTAGTPGQLTIPAGQTEGTICVQALAKACRYEGAFDVFLVSGDPAVTVDVGIASVTLAGSPAPALTVQPQDQQVTRSATATLAVAASGAGLSYQWYQGDSGNTSQPISGATGSTYTTPPITRTSRFWVQVRDACLPPRTLNSRTATISVPGPGVPELSASPAAVSPGGTSTLTWDWRGTNAERAVFEPPLPGVQAVPTQGSAATPPLTTTTMYTLRVFDADNRDNSNTVTITVAPQPSINSFNATSGRSTSTLTWSVANATSARIDPLVGDITAQLPSGSRTVTLPEGVTTFTLTAKGVGPDAVASRVVSTPCVQNDTTLCLRGDRFRVTGTFELENNGGSGPLHFGRFDGGVSGYFHYDNPRVIQGLIKMPDFTCGATGTYWVFVGGATDQKVDITFLDTLAPEELYTISNPSKRPLFLNPEYRFDAFRTCDVSSSVLGHDDPSLDTAPDEAPVVYQASPLAAPCVEGPTTLCLSGGRFKLEGTYETQDNGPKGALVFRKFPGVDTSAVFSFVHNQAEVQGLVTLPDNFCDVINRQSWWLIMAGLTDQGLQLKATDLTTGEVKNVTSNPVKSSWRPQADFSFFPKVTFGRIDTNLSPQAGSGKLSFDVSADCAGWTATVLPGGEWLTFNPASGPPGPAELTYSYGALTGALRTATLRISWFGGQRSRDFTFTQSPPSQSACVFRLDPVRDDEVSPLPSVRQVRLTAGAACSWKAFALDPWITIRDPQGIGDAVMTYDVDENPGAEPRSGRLRISDAKEPATYVDFLVNQRRGCPYVLVPSTLLHGPAGGSGFTVQVQTDPGCPWLASSSDGWIQLQNTAGTGPGAFQYSVAPWMASRSGTRTGAIRVASSTFAAEQIAGTAAGVYYATGNNSVQFGSACEGQPWTPSAPFSDTSSQVIITEESPGSYLLTMDGVGGNQLPRLVYRINLVNENGGDQVTYDGGSAPSGWSFSSCNTSHTVPASADGTFSISLVDGTKYVQGSLIFNGTVPACPPTCAYTFRDIYNLYHAGP